MRKNIKYDYFFSEADYSEMKLAPEDTFYEEDGLTYSQFYKGQPLPVEIWNEVFSESQETESLSSNSDTEDVLVQETQEVETVDVEKVPEKRTRKRRQKSIVKK